MADFIGERFNFVCETQAIFDDSELDLEEKDVFDYNIESSDEEDKPKDKKIIEQASISVFDSKIIGKEGIIIDFTTAFEMHDELQPLKTATFCIKEKNRDKLILYLRQVANSLEMNKKYE